MPIPMQKIAFLGEKLVGLLRRPEPLHFNQVENASGKGAFWMTITPYKGTITRFQVPVIDFKHVGNDNPNSYFEQELKKKGGLPFVTIRHGRQGMCEIRFNRQKVISVTRHYLHYVAKDDTYIPREVDIDHSRENVFIDGGQVKTPDKKGHTTAYVEISYGDPKKPSLATIEMVYE